MPRLCIAGTSYTIYRIDCQYIFYRIGELVWGESLAFEIIGTIIWIIFILNFVLEFILAPH